MKNYYLDFEFMEGVRRSIRWLPAIGSFNKKTWFIEMISIGIVCDDGREYYSVNKNYNPRHANNFVKKNVIPLLPPRKIGDIHVYNSFDGELSGPMPLVYQENNPVYKTLDQIKQDILDFVGAVWVPKFCGDQRNEFPDVGSYQVNKPLKFYGYYADYDWVLFCTLFGTMMDLPKGMPMFCNDLMQSINDLAKRNLSFGYGTHEEGNKVYPRDLSEAIEWIKSDINYPKQINEHSALCDARWNKSLHEYLKTFRSYL